MLQLTHAIPFTLAALLGVTILTVAGSISSRIFKFSYVYWSILSFAIYTLLGYLIGSSSNLSTAFLASLVVGFYDATACWKLSLLLKANFNLSEEEMKNLTVKNSLTVMLFVAPFFAFIGYLFK
jgi:hypothetical protein